MPHLDHGGMLSRAMNIAIALAAALSMYELCTMSPTPEPPSRCNGFHAAIVLFLVCSPNLSDRLYLGLACFPAVALKSTRFVDLLGLPLAFGRVLVGLFSHVLCVPGPHFATPPRIYPASVLQNAVAETTEFVP